jgi:hypothetical protein
MFAQEELNMQHAVLHYEYAAHVHCDVSSSQYTLFLSTCPRIRVDQHE